MAQSLDRLKQQFADRFERDGDAYVFRPNLRAPGYRVSNIDRDRLITEFNRRIVWSTWGIAALIIVVIAAICWMFFERSEDVPSGALWLIGIAAVGAYLAPFYWIWNAPQREICQATPVLAGRPKDEAKRIALARLSWKQLGAMVVMTAALLWRTSATTNLLVGWSRLWLVFASAIVLIIAIQAVRKLRSEREKRVSD